MLFASACVFSAFRRVLLMWNDVSGSALIQFLLHVQHVFLTVPDIFQCFHFENENC